MLRSARAKLGAQVTLVQADACDFDAVALFGSDGFDRVVLSYSLSMIPEWERALRLAAEQVRRGGALHVVDFGDQTGLPRWFRRMLHTWLARFHVAPRLDLPKRMQALAEEQGFQLQFECLYRDYARYVVLTRSKDT
jgi:S-adenosylmethionine-diacylgycerolhomoserine-N-methlytransferase